MFRKILIANRGEIAVRVIRTARRMGIASVAVYCDVDGNAPHVELADEAINIGPPPASASYLDMEKIVAACRESGADAVHPGYGFLSERAAFAQALAEAGITFIGPNARAIAVMGDKLQSKRLAAEAGVATVPGHPGTVDDSDEAVAVARDIGYPVMIKASAGGGGKGMRIAWSDAEIVEGFGLARSEAWSSFGDDRLLVEKFIEDPRHIEIQVLGDRHGNLIHLGERECSIQRRNQKIVEEAPSPAVDAALRARMGGEALSLAKAVGYNSAGTVEFIVGPRGDFYFLEMNTRLQVEHPVTEFVTRIDLVEEMIRVAAGEPLTLRQKDVRIEGWAIESRLYAEDPYRDFLPSIGRLNRYSMPAEVAEGATRVRIDSGVVEGSEISIYFDPLIAKLITYGPDRAAATNAMADALDHTVIDGVGHNVPFLSALMDHPRWREGRLSTNFIDDEYPDGFAGREPDAEIAKWLAAVASFVDRRRKERFGSPRDEAEDTETSQEVIRHIVRVGSISIAVSIIGSSPGARLEMAFGDDAQPVIVESAFQPGDAIWSGAVGDRQFAVQIRPVTGGVRLSWRGVDVVTRVMTERVAALDALMLEKQSLHTSAELRCPMPGLVVAILVQTGTRVHAGQTLAIVEAMKMENVLRADRDAVVKSILAQPGDILAVDAVIMEFERIE